MVRELGLLANESPFELPLSFRHVLIELDLRGQLTQVELTELLILDKSTMSRMIKKLEGYKLVKTAPGQHDKRFKLVSLTSEGKEVVNGIHQSAITNVGRALLRLSSEERVQVQNGLSLYANALEQARLGDSK